MSAILITACGTPEELLAPEQMLDTATQELTGVEFTWTQGQSAVGMGPAWDRICFLTGMAGNFKGSGESVRTFIENGSWYLGGSSYQIGVTAYARCVYTQSYSHEYTWNQGEGYQPMGSAFDRVCFLTRVAGKFEGGAEWVQTLINDDYWYLGGNSNQHGVSGSARCIYTSSYSSESLWSQNSSLTYMGDSASRDCFLTHVSGGFKGPAESVRVRDNGWDSWYLGGGGGSYTQLNARARCVYNGQVAYTYVSDMPWSSAVNGYGPVERDQSNGDMGAGDGRILTLNGATYAKGLGVHAHSELVYGLAGRFTSFQAHAGVDDEVGANGSVVFEVWVDGVKADASPVMTGNSATRKFNVNVTGAWQLRLVVEGAGDNINYDHADWAHATLVY